MNLKEVQDELMLATVALDAAQIRCNNLRKQICKSALEQIQAKIQDDLRINTLDLSIKFASDYNDNGGTSTWSSLCLTVNDDHIYSITSPEWDWDADEDEDEDKHPIIFIVSLVCKILAEYGVMDSEDDDSLGDAWFAALDVNPEELGEFELISFDRTKSESGVRI